MQTSVQPLQSGQRTIIVDMLRGWALLGVVIMNYIDYATLAPSTAKLHSGVSVNIVFISTGILLAAKSWTMLSLLFGYGFAALIENVKSKGVNPNWFFIKRMFWLFVLAFINCCFFFGDILKDYAFMGLIILLFSRISGKGAIISGVVLIFLIPVIQSAVKYYLPFNYSKVMDSLMPLYHSNRFIDVVTFQLKGTYLLEVLLPSYAITVHAVQLACMLLGMGAYKLNIFNNLHIHKKLLKRFFWSMLTFTLVLILIFGLTQKFKWGYTKYYNLGYLQTLSMMLFTVSGICWIYINGKLKMFFRALHTIGKMTLTNYMVQNVISFFVFSAVGFGVFTSWHPGYYVAMAIAVYTVQVYFSKWWLSQYKYGPIEWVWRQLSYGQRLPLKKDTAVEIANAGI